jgi:hypothetical protein
MLFSYDTHIAGGPAVLPPDELSPGFKGNLSSRFFFQQSATRPGSAAWLL